MLDGTRYVHVQRGKRRYTIIELLLLYVLLVFLVAYYHYSNIQQQQQQQQSLGVLSFNVVTISTTRTTSIPSKCSSLVMDDDRYHVYLSTVSSRIRRRGYSLNRYSKQPKRNSVRSMVLLPNEVTTTDDDRNSTSNTNSTYTLTSSSPSKFYDLGVGKHLPKQSLPQQRDDNNNNTTIATTTTTIDSTINGAKITTLMTATQQQQEQQVPSSSSSSQQRGIHWMAPEGVRKPITTTTTTITKTTAIKNRNASTTTTSGGSSSRLIIPNIQTFKKSRRMVARDNEGQILRGALWDEQHYNSPSTSSTIIGTSSNELLPPQKQVNGASLQPRQEQKYQQYSSSKASDNLNSNNNNNNKIPPYPKAFYPDIDLSIPDSVYNREENIDLVWDLLRYEAYQNQIEQQYEPLLVSYLHSTILNHDTLESSLAFLLANRLQSPAMMISTQLQSLIYNTLQESSTFRRMLRADIMAVRDRDPACHTLPDVFLYFKGFHALQSYRTAHVLWNTNRQLLAQYLHSQVSQIFQIDIHPNATIGTGIMLDHGTGIVIGETATVGHNCSILHQVTLGGSGKKGVIRHPSVGNGVLVGAGATLLGPINIGDGCQIGAGTLVISDIPPHSVAVGVPARIIGNFVDVTEQPSIGMDQIMEHRNNFIATFESDGI